VYGAQLDVTTDPGTHERYLGAAASSDERQRVRSPLIAAVDTNALTVDAALGCRPLPGPAWLG
jgi:hypothetical protein